MDDLGSCPKDLVVNFKAVGSCNNLGDSWVRVERGEGTAVSSEAGLGAGAVGSQSWNFRSNQDVAFLKWLLRGG